MQTHEQLVIPKAQNRTRSGQGRSIRPFRIMTEESVHGATLIDTPSERTAAFVVEKRNEARADADLIAQLFAATNRFKVRLMRRVQYVRLCNEPDVVSATKARLEDERAALSVVQAHAVVALASAQRRVQQIERVQQALRGQPADRHELENLRAAVMSVVDDAQKLIDETRVTIRDYSEISDQLI